MSSKRRLVVALFVFGIVVLPLRATSRIWTGAVDHKLSTPGNWTPAGTPVTGDELTLYILPTAALTLTNDLPPGTQLGTLNVHTFFPTTIIGNPLAVYVFLQGDVLILEVDVTMLSDTGIGGGYVRAPHINVAGGNATLGYCEITGGISGTGALTIVGLKLEGVSTFTGPATVPGLFSIEGSATGMTTTVVPGQNAFGKLRGTGFLGDTTVTALLDPGTDPCTNGDCVLRYGHTIGTLTVGNLTISGNAAETAIDLSGGMSDMISASSVSLGGTLSLFTLGGTTPGDVYKIIDNRGGSPVTGTFAGASEGARVTAMSPTSGGPGQNFLISYHGGDGNDVTLTARGRTTVTLMAPSTHANPGVAFPVTVHVEWDGPPPIPPGTVKVSLNGNVPENVALDSLGDGTFNAVLQPGNNSVSATYDDTVLYDGSVSSSLDLFGGKRQTVLVASPRPDPALLGRPFTLSVLFSGTASPTGAITVSEGSTLLAGAAVSNSGASVNMPPLGPGSHLLTIVYPGDDANAPASTTVTQQVGTVGTGFVYVPRSTDLTLDITVPDGAGPFPLIIALQTNHWSTAPTSATAMREVARGWAVATVRFRAGFPLQVEDLKTAIRWLRANAALFSLQSNRIVAWGIGPAGGQLASLLGTSGNVAQLDDPSDINAAFSSRVQGVIDWSGADDLTSFGACASASLRSAATALGPGAVPSAYASADDPPFLLMHGSNDCAVTSAAPASLANALMGVSVDTTFVTVNGAAATGSEWDSPAVMKTVDDFLDGKVRPPTNRRRSARHP